MKSSNMINHPIPTRLTALIEQGKWVRLPKTSNLSALPIDDKVDLAFFDQRRMIQNTEALFLAVENGDGAICGLSYGAPSRHGFLDIEKIMIIAATYGQEFLALDYSLSDDPRVMSTNNVTSAKWVEVASTFDDFLGLLDL